jgi:hypothetical protein
MSCAEWVVGVRFDLAVAAARPSLERLARLRRACPEAASVAFVAGDPCYDRLVVSAGLRDTYRRALGVGDRRLVAVTSAPGLKVCCWSSASPPRRFRRRSG